MPIDWRFGPDLPTTAARTLGELLATVQARHGRQPVLTEAGRTWTWDDLLSSAGRLTRQWRTVVPPGSRLGLVLPNGAAHVIAELAAWSQGAVAVPLPAALGATALVAALQRFRVTALVSDLDLPGVGLPRWSSAEVLTLADRPGPTAPWSLATPDTPCLLLATSGSSGRPRGVLLSHGNLASQQAAYAAHWPEVGPGDRLASYLPWHHSFGALAERLWALVRGAHLTVVPGGGRDHPAFLATLAAVQPTVLLSVPRMHRVAILGGAAHLRQLRWAFNAGATLAAPEEAWYASHGIPLYEGWGLTETSPTATLTRAGQARPPGIVGEPVSGVAVGVRDDGHLLIAGPGVMLGYDDDPQATAACLGHDPRAGRWIDSGDLGAWTAQGLALHGRSDLTIKLANGEKVALGAIAAALEAAPGIRAASVVSRDGETLEAIMAELPGHGAAALQRAVARFNRAEPVRFRRIARAWRLTAEPSCANGLLTPSLKVARAAWLEALHAGRVSALTIDGHGAAET
jgi:long-chain acyl-CoA synthetase